MEAKIDNRVLKLTGDGKLLGELLYHDFTYIRAELKMANGEKFELRPDGFFGSRIRVSSGTAEVAYLSLTWQGHIRISYPEEKEYLIATKGAFSNDFLLKDQTGETLVHLVSKFDWRRFIYQYAVESSSPDAFLVLLSIYSVTYHLATLSGATSGLA